jgi:hypothetical protein
VSLVHIVNTDEVRDFLASAERELSDGRLSDALASIAKAFAAGFRTIDRSLQRKGLNIILPVLGIDFHNYERYKALTPNIQRSVSGKFMVAWLNKGPSEDPEQVQWSIEFVADFMVRVEARFAGFIGQNV